MRLALLPLILLAAPTLAAPIDGTWKSDMSTAKLSPRPMEHLLAAGKFSCTSCVPAYTVPADGKYHAVTGQDYWDEASVTIVDPRTVNYAVRRKGKLVGSSTDTVSADGNTLTSSYKETGTANGTPVEGGSTATRLKPAPAGAHAISGAWQRAAAQANDAGLNQTFLLEGDTLKLTAPTGETYAAKLGGPAVPIQGDPAGTLVQVKRVGAGYEETGIRAGKPVYRMIFTPSADGRTLAVSSTNLRTNATTTFTATKQ